MAAAKDYIRLSISRSREEPLEELRDLMGLTSASAAADYLVRTYIDREIAVQRQLKEQAEKLRDG